MESRELKKLIVETIGRHSDEINRYGLTIDREFLNDLADELALEANRQGYSQPLTAIRQSSNMAAVELGV